VKSQRKAHIFSFLCLAVFCFLAAGSIEDSSSKTSTSTPTPEEPPINVSAERLFEAYQRNEIAADSVYKGKTLEVTGTVTSINKDIADSPYLMLATSNEFMGVHADLQGNQMSAAATLTPGSVVTVVCQGEGMILGSPMLKDCAFR